jgi:Uma2 family endonuclease
VCQPDVLVLLGENLGKIAEKRIIGALDLVVEVALPGTAVYDRLSKAYAYARAEVAEYWIVDLEACAIEVFVLQDQTYRSLGIFQGKDILPSWIIPGVESIRVEQFFS